MNLYQAALLVFLSVLVLQRSLTLPIQDVSDPGMPFLLKVTPALVNRYTANEMALVCEHNPSVHSELNDIFRIRILKQSTSGWDLVAEQRDNEDSSTVSGNATAAANVRGDVSDVFLKVSWDTIGLECFGVFKCEVFGFDAKDEVLAEKSSALEVYEFKNFIHHLIALSVDTQEKVQEMENFTDTEIARLDHGFQRLEKSFVTNQSIHDAKLDSIEIKLASLERSLSDTDSSVSSLGTNQFLQENRLAKLEIFQENLSQWPAGYYALLRPKSGCPLDLSFFGGTHTYVKLHTQSQSSSDPANDHSAAFQNIKYSQNSNRFLYLDFCEITREINTVSWPQGSFCVNKLLGHPCPSGFSSGIMGLDLEDTNHATVNRNNVAIDSSYGKYLYFCCQDTASATVPIQLPTHSPFLLYRYGGVCQTVQGMSVSQEFIQINTEDINNDDYLSGSHPDVDQPGSSVIKFNLCYYTKL